ncbi:hypothetical protein P4S65_20335 [Pseudoalteromonas sp. B131b]|uniref:hypothetical protein n=1 Tax=Pseudoalteromonas sp. B131b TaxID=630493 RepID=UPI00301BBAD2
MKYLILIMALISAFFVSAVEPDMSDLKSPQLKNSYILSCFTSSGSIVVHYETEQFSNDLTILHQTCSDIAESLLEPSHANCPSDPRTSLYDNYIESTRDLLVEETSQWTGEKYCRQYSSSKVTLHMGFKDGTPQYSCPPDISPEHTITVPVKDRTNPSFMCAKPLVQSDNECSEFGNDSMLPHKSGVGSQGQNACYTNPSNGLSCQYVQGGDNFTATGKECTGDENDYGDKPTPEPPKDDGDPNCYNYGSLGQILICDVDPNEGCNPLQVHGELQYQCPSGCGSMDGVYFCAYDDKDEDGIPDDKNGNGVPDKDEVCVNGRCKPKPPTDGEPPTTPTPEAPDMTKTNERLDGIKGELGFIGGKIDKTNSTLNGINSGVEGLKKIQGEGNKALGGIEKNTLNTSKNTQALSDSFDEFAEGFGETDIDSQFNQDASSSFYESVYEDGFQGVWDEKSALIKQTGFFTFLDQFKLSSGGSSPDMQICFDSTVNLGCQTLDPDWQLLMPFLKLCIFITAAFVCRRIIFGG